jgi:hypothetical protein
VAQGRKASARRPARGEPHRREAGASEQRVARLTILIDPTKKRIFEEICAAQDLTPSQVVRRLIRQYVGENAGGRLLPDWLTGGAERRAAERKKAAPAKAR